MTRGCVGACGSPCWNRTFQPFVFFALLAAAAYSYGHNYGCVDYCSCFACLVMMYTRYVLSRTGGPAEYYQVLIVYLTMFPPT